MDGDFVVTRIAKKPPCRSVLGAIRGRCKSMPDIEPLCLPAVERLEHLHPDVVHRSVEDPLRVQYVEMLVRLWKITYMRPLLVRLAKCDTIAQMIGTLQVDIDGLGRGLGCGDDEEEMTKWRDEWKNSRAQQFSFLERLTSGSTDRKLIWKRRAPQGASVPTALFTEPVGPPTAESTPLQSGSNDTAILQQLYDSDDDLVPIDSTQEEAQAPRTKRDRDVTQEAPADRG
ncbi:hypothetical protein PF010_g27839, partial [Phytophthora fragariae]